MKQKGIPIDTGAVELIGRHMLIAELIGDGIEAALPLRDRGVDLIAYLETHAETHRFYSIPIQLKAASGKSFSIDKKYAGIRNLLLVYVWGASGAEAAREFYAMSYAQALEIMREMGYDKSASWRLKGKYSTSVPSKNLIGRMQVRKMTRGCWTNLIVR